MREDNNLQDNPLKDAKQRVQALLDSSAYRPADEDIDYLNGDDTRGIRLLLDYQKPQSLMTEHGIDHTIVVFGGTRIVEPATAQNRLDDIQRQLDADPDNESLKQMLARARRVLEKSGYYTVAQQLGHLIGQTEADDADTTLTMMTGGGPGIMEAANRGAYETGARTIGLNISLPDEQTPNSYLTPGLCFNFHYFATRKLHFLLRARALVAFPGGFGTLDELFDTLTLIQTEKIKPLPVVLVGESFWKQALNIPFLLDEGVIDSKDTELFWYAETAEEIWQGIHDWYRTRGTPLK